MHTTLDIAAEDLLSELAREEPERFYGFEPLPSRGRPVSNELIDKLREAVLDVPGSEIDELSQ